MDHFRQSSISHSIISTKAGPAMSGGELFTTPTRRFHLTRRGKILQSTTERYLRDDLGYGTVLLPTKTNTTIAGDATELVPRTIENIDMLYDLVEGGRTVAVVDTNVLLHHMDVLEYIRSDEGIHNSIAAAVVIPQTALEECRNRSLVMYRRVTDLIRSSSTGKRKKAFIVLADLHHVDTQMIDDGEVRDGDETKINDENDARLRRVAEYYGRAMHNHQLETNLEEKMEVIFLSDDAASRLLAKQEQSVAENVNYYTPRSMREHVAILQKEDPSLNLLDMVAQFNAPSNTTQSIEYYPPHIPSSQLSLGLKTNKYYQGTFRSDRDSYNSGYATVRGGKEERVAVVICGDQNVNRAVDGDVVAIELFAIDKWLSSSDDSKKENAAMKEKAGIAADTAEPSVKDMDNVDEELVDESGALRRPTGQIVGIIRRNFNKNYCGSIWSVDNTGDDNEQHRNDIIAAKHETEHADGITSTVVFFSIDPRVPPVLIRTTQRERLLGMRLLVSMDSWPSDSEFPLGHYVKTLGVSGTKDTETEVLLQEFRIPCEPFPAKVLACLPSADYKIELEPGRADLRHLPILSIDPPGCKDIDDALHCIELENGNWQVGVHIADVTHYVEAGSAIDLEAANRSTSTYLVNKRLDMLPALLTTDLCSLKGNVDRFAFSVLWTVTPDADIVDVEFKKTIIHSIAALTYQQAQSLIDKPDNSCKNDIQAGAVKRLASLARKFRSRRINAGALTLASPEVKFVLDSESLNPTDVQAYTLYEANAVVEEFMLLANVTVAKKILRHYPTLSILRRHPAPNRSMFDGLIQKAKTRGISICIDDSKKLADSLDAAGKSLDSDPYLDQLLRILSTRCMSPAQYFCSGEYQARDWHHYGLAAPVYTHFTSPIRRYADVCVHRLLAAAIGVAPLPVFLSSKSYLHDLAANMNRRHRAAQLAGRASVQLHTLIFFSGDDEGEGGGVKEEDAYVLDVETNDNTEPSFSVMVPRYGIEGRVRLSHFPKDDPCLVRDPEKFRLCYKDAKSGKVMASVAVFDKVRVKIWVKKSRDHRELIVDLIQPNVLAKPDNASGGKSKPKKQKIKK